MSVKSQEKNMRRLAKMLGQNLSYNWDGKVAFLKAGKTFLRALAKDLELQEVRVTSNAGGIAVSGECTLIGVWESRGVYIQLSQPCYDRERVLLYRTVKDMKDYTGGRNMYLTRRDLEQMSYSQMLDKFRAVRKEAGSYEWAA